MEENGLGPKSNYIPEVNAGANGSKKKKKDANVIRPRFFVIFKAISSYYQK